jgi:hypothetical protein
MTMTRGERKRLLRQAAIKHGEIRREALRRLGPVTKKDAEFYLSIVPDPQKLAKNIDPSYSPGKPRDRWKEVRRQLPAPRKLQPTKTTLKGLP